MKLSFLTVPYMALKNSFQLFAVVYFAGANAVMQSNPLAILVSFLALTLLTGVYSYLRWKRFDYRFDETNLKITKGILKRSERDIPLKRVQNVDVKRNILNRLLGLAVVSLETAGGSTTEASLKFVDQEQAQEVKKRIRELKQEEKDTEASEKGEDDISEELYRMEDKELLLLGLTGIDQRLLFGFLGLISLSASSIAPVLEESGVGLFTGLGLVSAVGLTVVVASNFVTNFTRFYDFVLQRRNDTLEYSRGLLNRSEGSVPLRKLQRLVISDNPLKRVFDRASLSIETAGYSAKDQELELAIPLDKREEIDSLVNELEGLKSYELESIPVRTMRRYFTRYMLISVTALSIHYFWTESFYYLSVPLIVVLSMTASLLKWRHIGYCELENHFVVRKGFWNRQEIIVPYYRTQNIIMSDTVLQRLWDLSSVTLDIAGTGFMSGDAKVVDMDKGEAWDLSKRLHEKFQESRLEGE